MSEVMMVSLIFLGGLALVLMVVALDEMTAFLGLQPRSAGWQLAPISKATRPAGMEGRREKPGLNLARTVTKKRLPGMAPKSGPVNYSPILSGLPATSK